MPRYPVRSFGTSSLAFTSTANSWVGFSGATTTAMHNVITDKVTVAAWIQAGAVRRCVFNKRAGGGGSFRCFTLEHSTTNSPIRFLVENTSNVAIFATAPSLASTPTGVWVHVVGIYDGAFVRLYLNGVKVAETAQTGTIRQDNNQITIGSFASSALGYGGLIDSLGLWNRDLTDAEIKLLCYRGRYPSSGLLAHYNMNEGSGTVLNDISGNNYTGTINNAPFSLDVPATVRSTTPTRLRIRNFRASAVLNGSNSRVAHTTAIAAVPTAFSGSVWFRQSASQTANRLILRAGDGSAQRIGLITSNQQVKVGFYNGTVYTAKSGFFRVGEWNHTAFTWDGTTMRLWINGIEQAGTNAPISDATTGVVVGDQSGAFYLGQLCALRLWTRVLTPAELVDVYVSGKTIGNGLYLSWVMGEGAGLNVVDTSGNGRDGTVSGTWTYSRDVPLRSRKPLNGNLVLNGDFTYTPLVNVPTTSSQRWVEGSAAGSQTNDVFGWAASGGGPFGVQFDTAVLFNGKPTMKLFTTGPGANCSTNTYRTNAGVPLYGIPALPNTQYKMSGWIKTIYYSGDSNNGASIAALPMRANGNALQTFATAQIKTTTDWTYYETTFTTAPETNFISAEARLYGHTGTATLVIDSWFADLHLVPIVPTSRLTA